MPGVSVDSSHVERKREMRSLGFRRLGQLVSRTTFVQRLGGFSPLLAMLVLEISHRCNLDCSMCPQAASRRANQSRQETPDMPWSTFTRVIDSASTGPLIRPRVHLIGGEPLLHPRLDLRTESS